MRVYCVLGSWRPLIWDWCYGYGRKSRHYSRYNRFWLNWSSIPRHGKNNWNLTVTVFWRVCIMHNKFLDTQIFLIKLQQTVFFNYRPLCIDKFWLNPLFSDPNPTKGLAFNVHYEKLYSLVKFVLIALESCDCQKSKNVIWRDNLKTVWIHFKQFWNIFQNYQIW